MSKLQARCDRLKRAVKALLVYDKEMTRPTEGLPHSEMFRIGCEVTDAMADLAEHGDLGEITHAECGAFEELIMGMTL